MIEGYLLWKGWGADGFGRFSVEDALLYRAELRSCGIGSLQGVKVGELGYGNGTFAGWVRKEGGDWSGREVIPELQEKAAAAGFKTIAPESTFSEPHGPMGLDLVVAFDVLEHLDVKGIRSFLAEAREALRPGGLLMVRLPSGDSPFSGAIFTGDLTHRTLLGSGAARQLSMEVGLEVLEIRPPALPIWGLGFVRALRRMVVMFFQAIVHAFIRKVLMSQEMAIISPNMVIVFRKPGLPG